MLTDAAIKRLKPAKARYEKPDAHGLYLVVEPTGRKSWVYRYRYHGKTKKLWLGTCDVSGRELHGEPVRGGLLTLVAARRLHAEERRKLALGRDPAAEYAAEERHRVVAAADAAKNTFAFWARQYIELEARGEKANRGWRNTAAVLGLNYPEAGEPTLIPGGLAERWLDKPVTEISTDDVFVLIDEAKETGVPGREVRNKRPSNARAREMSVALSALLRWLRGKRRIAVDPMAGLARPEGPGQRERVLNTDPNKRRADELRWFWSAASEVSEPFGTLVKVLLLTGQRRSEVAEMRKRELSDDLTLWTIPSTRTKNKREHTVPLSPMVQELLKGVLANTDYVFATNNKTAISGFSKLKPKLDEAMLAAARKDDPKAVIQPWTLHDLRRTCVTGMAEIGIEPHVIEAVVNHISGHRAGVAGVYNLALYAEQKRKALERWANHVESIVSGKAPAKVVPMRKAR